MSAGASQSACLHYRKLKKRLFGMTIKNVLDKFHEQGCLCFPYGVLVRDQFLGKTPKALDMEVLCTKEEIETICLNN